jgi:hypothetical protein
MRRAAASARCPRSVRYSGRDRRSVGDGRRSTYPPPLHVVHDLGGALLGDVQQLAQGAYRERVAVQRPQHIPVRPAKVVEAGRRHGRPECPDELLVPDGQQDPEIQGLPFAVMWSL